jgi:outer membrane usher protein
MLQFNTMSGCAKLTQLAALIYLCIYVPALLAEDYFAPDFIETRGNLPRDVDISRFSKADGQMPGVYHVDVYLNGNYVDSRDIVFVSHESDLMPVLTRADFTQWGVKPNAQPNWMALDESATVENISNLLPGSQLHFQFNGMRLELSVPRSICDGILRVRYHRLSGTMD